MNIKLHIKEGTIKKKCTSNEIIVSTFKVIVYFYHGQFRIILSVKLMTRPLVPYFSYHLKQG